MSTISPLLCRANPTPRFDFVIGLLLGIILASMFFVIQNSRRKPIRAVFSGSSAKSTVRRPHPQRAFLQAVGKQTLIMKLQGFREFGSRPYRANAYEAYLVFFGTITKVEEEIRKLLDMAAWESNPIRFLSTSFLCSRASPLTTLRPSRRLCARPRPRLFISRGVCPAPEAPVAERRPPHLVWR